MARDLLNHWPDWVLGVVFIGGSVILTLGGLALVRRFLPGWRVVDSVDHVIGVAAMVMTLFALILAFVLFNLNSDYDSASAEVTAEANSLGALVLDARAFPTREQRLINAAVGRYVAEVRDHEFASLAKGHEDPLAQQLLYGVFAAVQRYSPVTGTQTAFYRSATAELTVIVGQHEARTAQAEGSIPPPLLALLILLAMMTLAVTLLLICAGRSLSSLPRGFEVVEVGRVRAGAQAYLGPRPGVGSPAGDMMVDGVLFPLGEALRPLGLWRPSTRTWRQQHAGSRPRCIGDIQALRAREVSRRRERLVSEFSKCVVAAFEQLASKRQARAVTAEPLGGLPVVVAVRRPWTPGGLGGLV